ncbi:MAG: hypothetical protein ACFFD4_15240 [Candidatus Odinarchaeota archaeon]
MTDMLDSKTSRVVSVTAARMVRLEGNTPVSLPASFHDALLSVNSGNALVVLVQQSKIIYIIPARSDSVFKLTVETGKLSPGFLTDLGLFFVQYRVNPLFSKGICFTETSCCYEGYFDQNAFPDGLVQDLKAIKGVLTVSVTVITG